MALDTTSEGSRQTSEVVTRWLSEIEACRKREKDFRETGKRVLELYDGTKAADTPFNILYSNTETLKPALYSALPRPIVQRRFKDDDPLGKAAAQAAQRVLEFLLDTNVDEYETFDDAMSRAVMTALLPGRAATTVIYDADMAEDTSIPVSSELVCPETKPWDRVYYGYAKTWTKVPWIAYEEYVDKEEATRLFGEEIASKLAFTKEEPQAHGDGTKASKDESHQGERKTCRIYQIWDKDGGRTVRYISEQYKEGYLKEEDDPLGLTGFFNCPKPLQFLDKPHSLTPTALYVLYESQAKELNELTRRIKHITKAMKAKGVYDGALGSEIQKLMEADECELVPTDSAASLAAEKGFDNAIWFWPVDKLIIVLRELYGAREQCKQVIYEITGISDILRGSSKASETLGAQEIKTQWGTLRLKRSQKEVARYARDLIRMMLEIAATKFSPETWAKMTGLPFLLDAQYNELTAIAQALTLEVQRVQAIQPPPPPGQAPPPSPQMQQLQQIQQQLQAPQWSQVLAMLKDDLQRAYRVDIETNSTVEPEAAEDQKAIAEVMTAMGQVLNGIGPLVVKGVLPFESAQIMLLTIVRRFRFGVELEDTIKAMQPPKPEDNGQSAELAKMQETIAQLQTQLTQSQQQSALASSRMDAERVLAAKERELEIRELTLKKDEEVLQLARKASQDECAMRDQLHQVKMSAADRVQGVREQTQQQRQKEGQSVAQQLQEIRDLIQSLHPMPMTTGGLS